MSSGKRIDPAGNGAESESDDHLAGNHLQHKPATDISAGIAASSALRIPNLPDDMVGAALAYAAAGWYVLPVDRATKDAGSVLGMGWPAKTSRDPDVIAAWFAGTDHGLALHVGRSGAIAFDVDHPDALPGELADLFRPAPFQSTRLQEPGRGHYMFACPAGRSFRNSPGKLGSLWGDVRGRNGIIVVEPTVHSKPGGRYLWTSSGTLPMLPEGLADRLVEHGGSDEDAATDAEVKAWLAAHPIGSRPGRLRSILDRYRRESSGSRHVALTSCLPWLCKEVNAGYLAAPDALREMKSAHTAALADPGHRNGAEPNRRDFWGVLAWAVAQAAGDPLVDGMNGSATTIQAASGAAQIAVAATEPAPEGDPVRQIPATGGADAFTAAVAEEAQRIRVREAARRQVAAEKVRPADFDAEYLDGAALDHLPTPDPLIDGVLNRHSYAILRGRDGTYKTFTALDWSLCLATGKPWQGRTVERVKVLYVAGEGAYGMASRRRAWRQAWRTEDEPGWFTVRRSAVNLFTGGPALDHLVEYIRAGGYSLVVIDTLRRASGGADGNGTDMGVVVDNLERIKRATLDGSVLALTHTDKGDNDSRGFSGIEDDADIVWHAKRDDDGRLRLECTKAKDGPDGAVITLTGRPVLESLILEAAAAPSVDELFDTDRHVLETLAETFAVTGATVTQLEAVTGMSPSTIYKARGRLQSDGRIVLVPRGGGHVMKLSDLSSFPPIPHLPENQDQQSPDSTPIPHLADSAIPRQIEHDSTPLHGDSTPSFHTDSTARPFPLGNGRGDGNVESVEEGPV